MGALGGPQTCLHMLRVGLRRGRQELSGPTDACRPISRLGMVTNGEHCQQSALTSPTQSHWVNRGTHTVDQAPLFMQTCVNINAHSQSHRYLPTFTSRFHTCLYSWSITFVVCARVCAFVIHSAVLYFYYDVRLTKKSLWWRISHIPKSHSLYQS